MTNAAHAHAAGKIETAQQMYESALDQLQGMNAVDLKLIQTLVELGFVHLQENDPTHAQAFFENAVGRGGTLLVKEPANEPLLLLKARALTGLAECQRLRAELPVAQKTYEQAISSFMQAHLDSRKGYDNSAQLLPVALEGSADTFWSLGDERSALGRYQQAAEISKLTAGNLDLKASYLTTFRHALWAAGQEEQATFLEDKDWADSIKASEDALRNGQCDEALRGLRQALDDSKQGGDTFSQAASALYLARAYKRCGQDAQARMVCAHALNTPPADARFKKNWLLEQLRRCL